MHYDFVVRAARRLSAVFVLSLCVPMFVGCDTGGDVIPLAKVEPTADAPKEKADATSPPKNAPASPSQLIYK